MDMQLDALIGRIMAGISLKSVAPICILRVMMITLTDGRLAYHSNYDRPMVPRPVLYRTSSTSLHKPRECNNL